jgi:sensor histidine kinase YesM
VFVGALVLGSVETGKALLMAPLRGADLGVGEALILNMPWWLLWAAFAPLVFWLGRREPVRERPARGVLVHSAAATTLSLLHLGFSSYLIWAIGRAPPGFALTDQFVFLLGGYLLMDLLTYAALLAGYEVVVSRRRIREVEDERRKLALAAARADADKARLEAQMTSARLRALRSELHPHFLFNSLNSVAALAERGDPRGAVAMVSRLGEMLRTTLDGRREPEVTVAEELGLVRLYLEIEAVRFGERLRTRISVEPGAESALVPTLILQPLVENAVRHGAAEVRGCVSVEVEAAVEGHLLRMTVRDSGPGPVSPDAGSVGHGARGVGLRNVEERLATRYGEAGRLELRRRDGGGAEATVTLPIDLDEPVEVSP